MEEVGIIQFLKSDLDILKVIIVIQYFCYFADYLNMYHEMKCVEDLKFLRFDIELAQK
jgi:hypothetical protein